MAQHFRTEFSQIPPITRVYTTACVLTTAAVVRDDYTACSIKNARYFGVR